MSAADTTLQIAIVALASGRTTYTIAKDDIFQPVREMVYRRSAGHAGEFIVYDEDGDHRMPSRMVHVIGFEDMDEAMRPDVRWLDHDLVYDPSRPLRRPGLLGQLIECVYCTSFWVSLIFSIAYLIAPALVAAVLIPLAVWGVANLFAVSLSR